MRRDEIIARLRKVAALAARGVGGEADNAEAILNALAVKHGIDLDALHDDRVREYVIPVGRERWRRHLLYQILWTRYPGSDFDVVIGSRKSGKKHTGKTRFVLEGLRVKLSSDQYAECLAVFEILQRDYERQQKAFFRAFGLKNDLLCPYDPDAPEPTPEQKLLCEDARRLAMGIDRSSLYPELTLKEDK